jgi:Zn-dependent peptidase ImmA (M78 family)
MATKARIREIVQEIISAHNITSAPIDIERLAKADGAVVQYRPFEKSVSGFSYSEGNEKIIGVNVTESDVRQRFTLAHEFGHLMLGVKGLHYDQGTGLQFRNGLSSTGTDKKEIEANFFAAELLMPQDMLIRDLEKIMKKQKDAEAIAEELARIYNVSNQAMNVRLTSLGLFSIV